MGLEVIVSFLSVLILSIQGITLMSLQESVCKGNIVEILCLYPDIQERNSNGEPKYVVTQPIWTQNGVRFIPRGFKYSTKTVNLTAEMLSINTNMTTDSEDKKDIGCCLVLTKNLSTSHSNQQPLRQIIVKEPPVPHGTTVLDPITNIFVWRLNIMDYLRQYPCFEYRGYFEITLIVKASGSRQQFRTQENFFSFAGVNKDQSYTYEIVAVLDNLRSHPFNGSLVVPEKNEGDTSIPLPDDKWLYIGIVSALILVTIVTVIVVVVIGIGYHAYRRQRKTSVKNNQMSCGFEANSEKI